jgi:hypothetical protein
MKRLLLIVIVVLVAGGGVVGHRWYGFITNTQSPFDDEVGMELNNMMPGPVNAYGCGKLKETFGDKTLPVYGCQDQTGRGWK